MNIPQPSLLLDNYVCSITGLIENYVQEIQAIGEDLAQVRLCAAAVIVDLQDIISQIEKSIDLKEQTKYECNHDTQL